MRCTGWGCSYQEASDAPANLDSLNQHAPPDGVLVSECCIHILQYVLLAPIKALKVGQGLEEAPWEFR